MVRLSLGALCGGQSVTSFKAGGDICQLPLSVRGKNGQVRSSGVLCQVAYGVVTLRCLPLSKKNRLIDYVLQHRKPPYIICCIV